MKKLFPGRQLKLKSAQHQSTHHQCCDASCQRAGAICPVSLNKSSIIYLVFVIGTWVRFFFYSVTAVVRSSLAGVKSLQLSHSHVLDHMPFPPPMGASISLQRESESEQHFLCTTMLLGIRL